MTKENLIREFNDYARGLIRIAQHEVNNRLVKTGFSGLLNKVDRMSKRNQETEKIAKQLADKADQLIAAYNIPRDEVWPELSDRMVVYLKQYTEIK